MKTATIKAKAQSTVAILNKEVHKRLPLRQPRAHLGMLASAVVVCAGLLKSHKVGRRVLIRVVSYWRWSNRAPSTVIPGGDR